MKTTSQPGPDTTVRKKHAAKDWHREEIKCAIRLKGYSIAALSRAHGLAGGTLANALMRPWPKGEKIIAHAIGIEPEEIWPTRYEMRRKTGQKSTKGNNREV
ncbi:helix-turn-helix transcriptional regulator [Erwinia sp. Eh17-17]|jgi:Ner family transcriptional regulator|uniref:helix-turn-helix domain-containing protein n=1 Tax=Erwinia sp. Eh17-17 TaxID=3080330 RepID=UPI003209CCFE